MTKQKKREGAEEKIKNKIAQARNGRERRQWK